MTKDEARKILFTLAAAYPMAYQKMSQNTSQETIILWSSIFEKVPYEVVGKAVQQYIATNASHFPPSPGEINQIIAKVHYNPIDPGDAWQQVLRALMDAGSYPQKAFDALPAPVQRAVGSAATLKQWAMTPTAELESFTKQRFVNQLKDQTTAEVTANIVEPRRTLEAKAQAALPEEKKPPADNFNPADHRPKGLMDTVPSTITNNPRIKKIFESWGVM